MQTFENWKRINILKIISWSYYNFHSNAIKELYDKKKLQVNTN